MPVTGLCVHPLSLGRVSSLSIGRVLYWSEGGHGETRPALAAEGRDVLPRDSVAAGTDGDDRAALPDVGDRRMA
jgi:hypothetical protein